MIREFQYAIFDLDNTLIRTEAIKKILWNDIAGLYGCDEDLAKTLYLKARDRNTRVFEFERYVQLLQRHGFRTPVASEGDNMLWDIVRKKGNSLQVPGAIDFLRICSDNHIRLYLLTVGTNIFQRKKIELSGLQPFFPPDRIFCVDNQEKRNGKAMALRKIFGSEFLGKKTLLVNDKPDEVDILLQEFPHLFVFIRREARDGRYSDKDFFQVTEKYPGRVLWECDLRAFINKIQ